MNDQNPTLHTLILSVRPDGTPAEVIERAAALLRAGKLVGFPTETVYGLGADATSAAAVARIFAAKDRPLSDPLIVHVPSAQQLFDVAMAIPPAAWRLAERFWPGPLTLVLPRAASIPAVVAAGGPTVGVRVPSHPVAHALLMAAGVPVAAPSANRFMHTSPTSAAHVLADLDGRIDCVLDGGPSTVGVESTVLDLVADPPCVLRPGGVTLEELRSVLPVVQGPGVKERSAPSRAPGQMERHYAPRTRLVVFDAVGERAIAAMRGQTTDALARGQRVGALLPDEEAGELGDLPVQIERLGPRADLAAISRRLYAALRALDDAGLDVILAHTFGREGLGLAIWDRLHRAADGGARQA
jgi:L-threonylcarbamoyladenylate synthase